MSQTKVMGQEATVGAQVQAMLVLVHIVARENDKEWDFSSVG